MSANLVTQTEYAQQRRCSVRTIECERVTGTGCPYVKLGRRVMYRQADGKVREGGKNLGAIGTGTDRSVTVLDAPFSEIKPGGGGAACTAQTAGDHRYADAKLQVCDGASWRVVALEPAR